MSSPAEILKQFPIRNKVWSFNGDSTFVTEASNLKGNESDPWGRTIRHMDKRSLATEEGQKFLNGELDYWYTTTSVAGVKFTLKIFND